MNSYLSFAAIALTVVFMPGPGTVKSIANSINYGLKGSIVGISGLTIGVCAVAGLSATSLGLLLVSSPRAFKAISYCGALYLFYLGVKLWFTQSKVMTIENAKVVRKRRIFTEGVLLQFTNPNAILFFFSIFPHFIDRRQDYLLQFLSLVGIFCLAFVCAHATYATIAYKAKSIFNREDNTLLNRINAVFFILLSFYLASSS